MIPSVKTLSQLPITAEQAKLLRRIMVEADRPTRMENALVIADEMMCTHGVEGFRGLSYCNTGETYNVTLMVDWRADGGGRFLVGSWGDFVERNERRFRD